MTFPMSGVFLALAFVGVGGRKLIEWSPVGARWLWRSTARQLMYRRRIVKPRPAGTLALPGDAARLRQWLDPETGAVMIHDPHPGTLTVIIGVCTSGVSCIGMRRNATTPNSVIRITPTQTFTGLRTQASMGCIGR